MENVKKQGFGVNEDEHMLYYKMWEKLLCVYGGGIEYHKVRLESKNAMFAIMRYRRLLRSRGLGNISFIALNTAYTQRDYIKLHNLLQELFLELITKEQFEYVLREIDKTENNMTKLYEKHMQNKNARILNRVLLL